MTALRARGERGLDDRARTVRPRRDGVPGEQAGADHDGRVRGVRARGDRGDRHRPVADLARWPPPPSIGLGATPTVCGYAARKFCGHAAERDAVLRAARTGQRRLDGREVELEQRVELGPVAGLAPQALGLRVALDEVDPLGRAAGQPQVGERLVVDREQRRRSPRTRGSCWRSSPGRRARGRRGRRPRTPRTRPTTPNARSISVMTSTRSVAVAAGGSSPWSRTPTIRGIGW